MDMVTDMLWLANYLANQASPGVIPALLGPLHALMLLLPQMLLGLVLVLDSLMDASAWRGAVARLWITIRTRPLKAGIWLCLLVAACLFIWWMLLPVQTSATGNETPLANGNWPTFHGAINRSGTTDFTNSRIDLTPELKWKFHDSLILERRPFACSPAVAGSRVLIGSDNYKLYCLDVEAGQLQWEFEAGYPIFSSPAVWNGRVYIGEGLHYDADTSLYCLNLQDGSVIWTFRTGSHTESSPTVDGGKVYFGAGDDGIYCLDAITSEEQWCFPDAHVDGGPLVVDDRVYFGSGYTYDGIICVAARDGRLVWKRDFRAPVWGAPSFSEGRLYVGIGNGNFNESAPEPFGEVRCLNPADGTDVWQFTGVKDSVLTSIAVSEDRAVFGSRDGVCYALNARTGELIWRGDIGAPILSSPAVASGHVLLGADDGKLYCLSLEDGQQLWSFDTIDDVLVFMETSSIQSSPAVVAGRVIFGSSNGNLYCLGGDGKATGTVAQTGYRSRLMRGADFAMSSLIRQFARLTRSYGFAIILSALVVKLILLPLDWRQTRQSQRLRQLQPEIRRLKDEHADYRMYLSEARRLYTDAGIRPLGALASVFLQIPIFVVVFLVIQATSVFAGKSFLWISDLSVPDRLAQIPSLPWLGSDLNLLPWLLMGSIWLFAMIMRGPGQSIGMLGRIIWLLLAIGIGVLTYRWSSALLLFTIALLWFGIMIRQAFMVIQQPEHRQL
jgi:YidC/Oxa1 family membrane protein insertase